MSRNGLRRLITLRWIIQLFNMSTFQPLMTFLVIWKSCRYQINLKYCLPVQISTTGVRSQTVVLKCKIILFLLVDRQGILLSVNWKLKVWISLRKLFY